MPIWPRISPGGFAVVAGLHGIDLLVLGQLPGFDPGDGTLLYLRPAADADLRISKQVIHDGAIDDIVIDRLQVRITYDYFAKPDRDVDLEVAVSEGLSVPVLVDRADLNGRRDGRGDFVRVYDSGETVGLEVRAVYGTYEFERWTDLADQTLALKRRGGSCRPCASRSVSLYGQCERSLRIIARGTGSVDRPPYLYDGGRDCL